MTYGRHLEAAKSNLRKAVDAGLNFDVQFPTIERVSAIQYSSLKATCSTFSN